MAAALHGGEDDGVPLTDDDRGGRSRSFYDVKLVSPEKGRGVGSFFRG